MGLGPGGSSLLHKLGQRAAYELTDAELLDLVARDRDRRTTQRTLGRVMKQAKEPKTTRTPKAVETLEMFGLDPNVIAKLRAGGKTDKELILLLRKAGLIK